MKALTLHQPWATLVAIGAKRVETRSWATKYRGPLAIHAAKVVRKAEPMPLALVSAIHAALLAAHWSKRYPLGAVVATCTLVDVVPIGSYDGDRTCEPWQPPGQFHEWVIIRYHPSTDSQNRRHTDYLDERAFGDFSPGRFAWLLADVAPLDPPVPAKGRQGLWEWNGVPVAQNPRSTTGGGEASSRPTA